MRRTQFYRITRGAALILGLALVACVSREPVAPNEPYQITLDLLNTTSNKNFVDTPNTVSCGYWLRARAVGGRAGDRSLWVGGESVWTYSNGNKETTIWSQAGLVDFFRISGLDRGEIASGRIDDPSWVLPYTVTHRIRYAVAGGDEKTATLTFSCL